MASSAADVGKLKDEALQLFAEAREKLAEAEVIQDKALAQYEDAKKIYAEALRSMNSVRAVVDAVDPEHVQEVLQGMGAGLLSCVAAAKAPVAASAVVGVDAGRILSSRLVPVMHSQLERRMPMDASARKWLDGGVSSLCSGVGLLLAYKVALPPLRAAARELSSPCHLCVLWPRVPSAGEQFAARVEAWCAWESRCRAQC
eukprot:2141949-Rhodomonas_salina.1